MNKTLTLLVVAPAAARQTAARLLSGASLHFSEDAGAACSKLAWTTFDAAVVFGSPEAVQAVRAHAPQAPIFAVVSAGDVQAAHIAGRNGADGCISDLDTDVAGTIARTLAAPIAQAHADHVLLASASPAARAAIAILEQAARSAAPVLLRGESGTGKTLLARHLHDRSGRRHAPFVVISCPALPPDLLASELFGHARGSFTGAVRDKPGRVEIAAGGTLFLDEIGDLSPAVQAMLLRFLQDRSFERVGETATRHADVRIVAATHRDLEADVACGRFRLDLFYRLSVVDVVLPPLRERREDVLALAKFLIAKRLAAVGRGASAIDARAQAALTAHSWPGNVRELENEIERALALSAGAPISLEHLSERLRGASAAAPFLGGDFTLAEIEREHIRRILSRARSFEKTATILGIDDSTLWRKRKRYAVDGRPASLDEERRIQPGSGAVSPALRRTADRMSSP